MLANHYDSWKAVEYLFHFSILPNTFCKIFISINLVVVEIFMWKIIIAEEKSNDGSGDTWSLGSHDSSTIRMRALLFWWVNSIGNLNFIACACVVSRNLMHLANVTYIVFGCIELYHFPWLLANHYDSWKAPMYLFHVFILPNTFCKRII
jgi:hypothetical protein